MESGNHGTFLPLKVKIPKGTFLSADERAPMGGFSLALPTVIDTVLKAMVPVLPNHMAGGHKGSFDGIRLTGVHPQTGELFMHLDSCLGGWGASKGCDGPGPYKTMVHGDTLEVPIELVECLYPVRVESYEIRPDSGGAGEFRGGNGIEKTFIVTAPCEVLLMLDRAVCPAWGVMGGQDAAPIEGYIERQAHPAEAALRIPYRLNPGDRFRILTAGGGGYGDPRRRDPAAVAADLRRGYISHQTAETVYACAGAARDR
jgi:N-methylhydantoinase B